MSQGVRTRYAPSPTGYQHIGGVRTALYCYLFTRHHGGTMVLRIEDTDRSRYVEGAEQYIIDTLEWLGYDCQEGVHVGGDKGPYRQSDRQAIYEQYAHQLVDSGNAYLAFDTAEELTAARSACEKKGETFTYNAATREQMRNSISLSKEEVDRLLNEGVPHVIRLRVPQDEEVVVNDIVRGRVVFDSNLLDEKVLFKSDGMPTYHLANVVDDHLMEISHVIRGEEWLPSTPSHVVMYKAFGWEDSMPKFAHLPLILKPTGKGKLSKRDADKLGFPIFPLAWESERGYRELGFFPEALTNFLAFLGWNPGTEQEIFSKEELSKVFNLDRVSKAGARFDFEKAKWFNQQYLMAMSDEDLAASVSSFAPEDINIPMDQLTVACGLVKERMVFPIDFWKQHHYLFQQPMDYDPKTVRKKWKNNRAEQFQELCARLEALEAFEVAEVEQVVKGYIKEKELGFGDILQPWRVMLTGIPGGPDLFRLSQFLGKQEVLKRMKVAMQSFDEMAAAI